ncbi:AraC family transcriptional regulator ligand-binding domain-containing protein [Mesorhizobium sp. LHD-90]|uniref:AraC family transcriptional regulator n=1 Tax=Mesorhizobium sp. LHD-90 TaxID=3071414 RepID=UPI0027DEB011|nr:AraC family transcriptional regulator ligand-binding domain-containing protein [Mesorhizobium sp. LHD-90]MDQ6436364.1 AraC family transcriptional regulator ligand-binding domain-containing protein [Mesorhizobium sp. LHD-90]
MNKREGSVLESLVATPTAMGLASRLAVAHLERRGINPGPLLRQAGLSPTALADRNRIPVISQMDFLVLVSRAVADDWIGLTLAADFDLREMGMLYYVAASSHRFGDALQRLERYARLGNEALVPRIAKGSVCRIGLAYTGVPRHLDRHQMEFLALAFVRLVRQLVGQKVMPVATSFVHHRSGDLREMMRHFGDGVEFGASVDEICLEPALLDAALVGEDPFLNELMLKSCEEAMAGRLSNVSPFRTLVENTIAPLLPHAEVGAKTVARRLGLSERTFSRRLKAEGLTFAEILNDLRRDLAVRHLEERKLPVSQIAWLLGFHGPSAFSHACRRWTGKSPINLRRDCLTSAAMPA